MGDLADGAAIGPGEVHAGVLVGGADFFVFDVAQGQAFTCDGEFFGVEEAGDVEGFGDGVVVHHVFDDEDVVGVEVEGLAGGFGRACEVELADDADELIQVGRAGLDAGVIHAASSDVGLQEGVRLGEKRALRQENPCLEQEHEQKDEIPFHSFR